MHALLTLAQDAVPPAVISAGGAVGLAGGLCWYLLTKYIPGINKSHADERTQLSEQNQKDRDTFLAAIKEQGELNRSALKEQAELHRQERGELRAQMVGAISENTAATRDLAKAIRSPGLPGAG